MVFFTCNSCSETLKRKAVKNHSQECRTSKGITCNDCKNVFREDYTTHLSCFGQKKNEAEVTKNEVTKGQKRQEEWINTLKKLAQDPDIDPELEKILNDITQKHDNFPRNAKKFKNYLTNSMKLSPQMTEKLGDYLLNKVPSQNSQESSLKEQKDSEKKNDNQKGKKKRKLEGENSNVQKKKKNNSESSVAKETEKSTRNGDASRTIQTTEKSKKKRNNKKQQMKPSVDESGDASQEEKKKRKLETEDLNVQKKKKNLNVQKQKGQSR